MRRMWFLLFCLLISNKSFAIQETKVRIAILELDAVGVSKAESITLTDRLRSELVKTGAFTVLERGQMDDVLKEQGFQQSGCTTDACAIEVGKILNVREICTGTVGKVGSVYTVAIRLIDVESSEIRRTVTEDCRCPVETVLTTSMKNVALKLAGRLESDQFSGAVFSGQGDIDIKSEPAGAQIFLDNVNTGRISPATLRDVTSGPHMLKVIKGDLIASKRVDVTANQIVNASLTLETAKGGIKVYSNPPDAEIRIDGAIYGKTPMIIDGLSVGDHALQISRSGYGEVLAEFKVVLNQYTTMEYDLKKPAYLSFKSNPSYCEVWINGSKKSMTPGQIEVAANQNLDIDFIKAGYVTGREQIMMQPGETKTLDVTLERETGTIVFEQLPKGAYLRVQDQVYPLNQTEIELPTNRHQLEIFKPGYVSQEAEVTVTQKEPQKIRVDLKAKTLGGAFTRSLFVPGWGQAYQDKTTRAWLYPLAIVASAAGAYLYKEKYNKAVADYQAVKNQYEVAFDPDKLSLLSSDLDEIYSDINSLEKSRDLCYIITGGLWLWNIVDVLILPPRWHETVTLSGYSNSHHAGLVFNVNIR